MLHYVV